MLSKTIQAIFIQPIANLILIPSLLTKSIGWGVVIASSLIQLVLAATIWSRYKTLQKIAQIHPLLEKYKKKYAKKPHMLAKKKQELYAKYNIKTRKMWLPLLLSIPFLIAAFSLVKGISENGINHLIKYAYPFVLSHVNASYITDISLTLLGINLTQKPPLFLLAVMFVTSVITTYMNQKFFTYLPREKNLEEIKKTFKNFPALEEKEIEMFAKFTYHTQQLQVYAASLITVIFMRIFPAVISIYFITYNIMQAIILITMYIFTGGGVTLPNKSTKKQ